MSELKHSESLKKDIVHNASTEAERTGNGTLVGKIYALLLFAPEPLSLQQIAERLQVSKAAVSVQIRTMVFKGLCRKLPRRNDRRDYYMLPEPLGKSIAHNLTDFWTARQQTLLQTLHSLASVPTSESEAERRILADRLSELTAMVEMLLISLVGMTREKELQEQMLDRHSNQGAT